MVVRNIAHRNKTRPVIACRTTFVYLLLSLIALGIGGGVQFATRPTVQTLESQAVMAWNRGDVSDAQRLARRALVRSSSASHARAVLVQVAAHDANPLLHVAVMLSVPSSSPEAVPSWFEAGETAFRNGYGAVAERAWEQVLEHDSGFAPAHDRLIGLAGIRLDGERMVELLLRRAKHLPQTPQGIRLLMGAESLHSEAASMEQRLRTFVQNDSSDHASLVGLGRCLNHLGAPRAAREILLLQPLPPAGRVELARVELVLGDLKKAAEMLPDEPPEEGAGAYWLIRGALIALTDDFSNEAVAAFEKAIVLRPLNRELRSTYCSLLRRRGDLSANQREADALRAIQEIELFARNPSSQWGPAQIGDLITRCEVIGAPEYVRQLRLYLESG